MTAQDVEGWDSLNHINLIVAIERALQVRFTTREVGKLANVGELVALVKAKLAV
jgi:acyl carrier protein